MAVVTVVERWGTSLHNVGKRTGLNMNGSSINKNKNKNKKNKHTYKQTLQLKQMKRLVLLRV